MQLLLEASSALQRAEGVLVASKGLAPAELTAQVAAQRRVLEQALADQRFIAELHEIRSWRADDTSNDQDFQGADRRYASAFTAHGLDVDRKSPAQVAEALAGKDPHVRQSLAAALDDWAYMRRQTKGNVKAVIEVAMLIDADSLRNRIRAAQEKETPQALAELQALARSPEALESPAATVHLLALAMYYRNDNDGAAALLRAAQRRHPDDFQINHDLAWLHLYRLPPSQLDQAIRFFTVALAIRPQSTGARLGLVNAFIKKRDFGEAAAILGEWIRSQPNNAHAHTNLAELHGERGDYAAAAAALGKAIELQPDRPYAWYCQAAAYVGAGDLPAYRKVCAAMLQRFGDTKDPWVAGRILYACVQGPDAVADIDRLFVLVDVARSDPNGGSRIHGAVLYRAAKPMESRSHMAKATLDRGWDLLFLAMAHHQLREHVEANRCFDKARRWMTKFHPHWTERAEGAAMMREAETLLRGKGPKRVE
jgi:tetratricopeptide (TPR) repeat protein